MAIYTGNLTLSIAVNSYLGSVVPGATSRQKAFPRERFSVVWCALSHIVQFGKPIASTFSAIGQLQRKMAVSSTAVVRRYNKLLYFPMKITLAIIFMIASSCLACELTPEAREARSYVSEQLRCPYNECIGSVNSFHYWQSVAKCEAEGKGANVDGGCQHIASRVVPETEPDFSHCEIFKVSAEEFVKVLEHYMEEENISRCSTSQPPAAGQSKAGPLPAG